MDMSDKSNLLDNQHKIVALLNSGTAETTSRVKVTKSKLQPAKGKCPWGFDNYVVRACMLHLPGIT